MKFVDRLIVRINEVIKNDLAQILSKIDQINKTQIKLENKIDCISDEVIKAARQQDAFIIKTSEHQAEIKEILQSRLETSNAAWEVRFTQLKTLVENHALRLESQILKLSTIKDDILSELNKPDVLTNIRENGKSISDGVDLLLKQTDNILSSFASGNETVTKNMIAAETQLKGLLQLLQRSSNESIWATAFHDAIYESYWLANQTFFPGRWAVGYPYLYALYRTLNHVKPKHILELGLGQTTCMIAQYAQSCSGVNHVVVEHDQGWIKFFENDFALSQQTEIIQCDITKTTFKDDTEVIVYKNLAEKIKGEKFDLISIDGPFGGKAKIYARIDILLLMPECLNESFVILMDDYERTGEKNTVIAMKEILKSGNIRYKTGTYSGAKDMFMLVSEDLKFLTTM